MKKKKRNPKLPYIIALKSTEKSNWQNKKKTIKMTYIIAIESTEKSKLKKKYLYYRDSSTESKIEKIIFPCAFRKLWYFFHHKWTFPEN